MNSTTTEPHRTGELSGNSDSELYNEWKSKSKVQLRSKIEGNYIKRANKSVNIINSVIQQYIPATARLPPFQLPSHAIRHSLDQLFEKINTWRGVDSTLLHRKLNTFQEYFLRCDNWWNRYKPEWIGDFFFYPLFNEYITQYITHNHVDHHELLQFIILKRIFLSEIKFRRSKAQPLLLDQCYTKSCLLQRFLIDIGKQHSVEWVPPPNVNDTKHYRNTIRKYGHSWIDRLVQHTLHSMGVNDINKVDFVCTAAPMQQAIPLPDHQCYCNCVHRCSSCNGVISSRPYMMYSPQSTQCSESTTCQNTCTESEHSIYRAMVDPPVHHYDNNNYNRPSATYRHNPYGRHWSPQRTMSLPPSPDYAPFQPFPCYDDQSVFYPTAASVAFGLNGEESRGKHNVQ
eukprot:653226_1